MPTSYSFEKGPFPFDLQLWNFYYTLWTDRRWVHRRVDTIGSSEPSPWMNIEISFDINSAILEATAAAYNISPNKRLLLPLMLQPRTHLLGFEADLNGRSQSLASNDDSARMAQAISFASFMEKRVIQLDSFKYHYEALAADTYLAFKDSSAKLLQEKIAENIEKANQLIDQSTELEKQLTDNSLEHATSAALLTEISEVTEKMRAHYTYAGFLNDFIAHINSGVLWRETGNPLQGYRIIVLKVDRMHASSNAILNLRFLSPQTNKTSLNPLSFRRNAKTIYYRQSLLGTNFENRYHIRIKVPPGLKIVSAERNVVGRNPRIIDNLNEIEKIHEKFGGQDNVREWHDTQLRKTSTSPVGPERCHALIRVEPDPRIFYSKALYTIVALLAFLFFAFSADLSSADIVTSSVALAALFIAVPKLLGRAEHEDFLTARILSCMRVALGFLITFCFIVGIGRQAFNNKSFLFDGQSPLTASEISECLSRISEAVLKLNSDPDGANGEIIGESRIYCGENMTTWSSDPSTYSNVFDLLFILAILGCILYACWMLGAILIYIYRLRKATSHYSHEPDEIDIQH